jgi:hypothetical protein
MAGVVDRHSAFFSIGERPGRDMGGSFRPEAEFMVS